MTVCPPETKSLRLWSRYPENILCAFQRLVDRGSLLVAVKIHRVLLYRSHFLNPYQPKSILHACTGSSQVLCSERSCRQGALLGIPIPIANIPAARIARIPATESSIPTQSTGDRPRADAQHRKISGSGLFFVICPGSATKSNVPDRPIPCRTVRTFRETEATAVRHPCCLHCDRNSGMPGRMSAGVSCSKSCW